MSLKRSSKNQDLYGQLEEKSTDTSTLKIPTVTKIKYETTKKEPTFNNEYLDQFLNEARQYNIDIGTRTDTDTSLNILRKIRNKSTNDVFDTTNSTVINTTNDAAYVAETTQSTKQEIENLLSSEYNMEMEEEKKQDMSQTTAISRELLEGMTAGIQESNSENSRMIDKILFETQELKDQLTTYQKKVDNVDTGINKMGKILDRVLVIIFVVLVGVLGVFVYYLLKLKGVF